MQIAGLIIMVVGSIGIIGSTIAEIRYREPIYALCMKIFPLIFAVGVILWGITR